MKFKLTAKTLPTMKIITLIAAHDEAINVEYVENEAWINLDVRWEDVIKLEMD